MSALTGLRSAVPAAPATLGEWVRAQRLAASPPLSLAELARALAVGPITLSEVERDKGNPRLLAREEIWRRALPGFTSWEAAEAQLEPEAAR